MNPTGIRVVVDTNVWISGLLSKSGAPALLSRHVVLNGQPVLTQDTFTELKDRLWRPKFDRYITIERRKAFLRDLEAVAIWADVPSSIATATWCRDAADDKFIHAALAAKCSWLITGDQDLLVLAGSIRPLGVSILSPADALALPAFSRPD